jgi:RNA polymerase sigma factor (sigma-70 family)
MQPVLHDNDIIRQVLSGRSAAYALLVDRYKNYVFTLVIRYVPLREEAEEISQDVFVKAFRSLADFKGTSKFSTWLYTIAYTSSLSHLRKKRVDTVLLEEPQLTLITDKNFCDNPFHSPDEKHRHFIIAQALGLLSPADAQIIHLFYLAEQSIEEIAVITASSASNVKVRLHRARNRLRTVFEEHFMEELESFKTF